MMNIAQRPSDKLQLAFLPDWSDFNPYQKILYDEISAAGIACEGCKGEDFGFKWLWQKKNMISHIHFHWLNGIYDPGNEGLNVLKLAIFLLKVIFAKFLGYKVLWTVHNLVSHEPTKLRLEILLRKLTGVLVTNIIVHCFYAKRKVKELWGINVKKVTVIPHGSYIGYYPDHINQEDARKVLGFIDSSFIFLFFGMLRNYKGIKTLISNFTNLRKQHPDAILIIAGCPLNESIKNEIESLASGEGISLFLRFIPDAEVQFYFRAADIVVLPYQNILTSGAAVLALSFGCPVIAPSKGCLPELLNDEVALLYDHDHELADVMSKAISIADIKSMGENAMQLAETIRCSKLVYSHYFPLLNQGE